MKTDTTSEFKNNLRELLLFAGHIPSFPVFPLCLKAFKFFFEFVDFSGKLIKWMIWMRRGIVHKNRMETGAHTQQKDILIK